MMIARPIRIQNFLATGVQHRPKGRVITFQADLKVTVTDNKTAATAGKKDTYTIVVINNGTISSSATGTLSDTATVTAPSGVSDPNLANNSGTDIDTLQ
jgi:hypothetical protein